MAGESTFKIQRRTCGPAVLLHAQAGRAPKSTLKFSAGCVVRLSKSTFKIQCRPVEKSVDLRSTPLAEMSMGPRPMETLFVDPRSTPLVVNRGSRPVDGVDPRSTPLAKASMSPQPWRRYPWT